MTIALDRKPDGRPRNGFGHLGRRPLGSVVIPAHDEARVIKRCLDGLFEGLAPGDLEVVVVCNGCADDTPAVARSSGHPIRVIERPTASKPAALRIGDEAATSFPRLYLDADVVLKGGAAQSCSSDCERGRSPPGLQSATRAAAPPPVRSYYQARSRIPAVLGSLSGAGVCGLSAAGRQRFDAFPDLVADDLWVDRHFDPSEVEIIDCAPVVVTVPRRSRDLVRVLRRTYLGKAEPAPVIDLGDPPPGTLGSDAGPAPACRDGTGRGSTLQRVRLRGRRGARARHRVVGRTLARHRSVGARRQLEGRLMEQSTGPVRPPLPGRFSPIARRAHAATVRAHGHGVPF